MPIYEAYPKAKGYIVKEYTAIDSEELINNHHVSRRILPNHVKLVTSVQRRKKLHFSLWGCEYMAYARGDEEETGIIRMTANSAFSWGVVYLPDRREFVRVLGTNNFQIGPQSPIFPLVRVTTEGDIIDKSIIWQPRRKGRR